MLLPHKSNKGRPLEMSSNMLFYSFYLLAITVLVLHFTGWLADHNMEWLVFVIAVLVFPVVLFL